VPFVKVHRSIEDSAAALSDWTDQDSYPAAMYEAERPRTRWDEILLLSERLEPDPPLIPLDERDRTLMFGLSQEILGEMGLVWCRRLIGMEAHVTSRSNNPEIASFLYKYGSSLQERRSAAGRVISVLQILASQLLLQRDAGSEFLVGQSISAVDIYWAVSANLFEPLPNDMLPMPAAVRDMVLSEAEPLRGALHPILLEHRNFVYTQFLRLPVEL